MAFLCASSYNVSEKAGSVSVTVQRTGNLNQYAIVLCRTEQGTATSSSGATWSPRKASYGGNDRTHMVRVRDSRTMWSMLAR